MKRRALRTKSVGTKVSEEEFVLLEERANAAGVTLSEWVRDSLLAGTAQGDKQNAEVILSEVLAMRSLMLNLLFRVDKRPIEKDELDALIERIDKTKWNGQENDWPQGNTCKATEPTLHPDRLRR